jgi:hypothetical protein
MSLPHFDPVVTLERVQTIEAGNRQTVKDFKVTGKLRPEQRTQDFAVLVSIWQTEEDTGSATNFLAHALGVGKHFKDSPDDTWSAEMTMRGDSGFVSGSPATGVGLIVAANEDPTSFETYSWIARLKIAIVDSATSAFH